MNLLDLFESNDNPIQQDVEEAKHFRTAYGWAGGYNEKTGKKYKHPEQIKQDREAQKQQKPQEKQPEVKEGVNAKQIKKDLDSGMSYDAVIGKHANKRLTNTDDIRRVIQQHAWEKRMKRPKEHEVQEGSPKKLHWGYHIVDQKTGNPVTNTPRFKTREEANQYLKTHLANRRSELEVDEFQMREGVSEDLPAHIKKSDLPPTMRPKLTMRDVEKERPQGAFRYRVINPHGGESDREFMSQASAEEHARAVGGRVEPIREGEGKPTPRIERILKQLRIRYPQAKDDLESLIYSFQDSAKADRRDINRLDQENDQEESDIEAIQKMIDAIRSKREAVAEDHPQGFKIARGGPNEDPIR